MLASLTPVTDIAICPNGTTVFVRRGSLEDATHAWPATAVFDGERCEAAEVNAIVRRMREDVFAARRRNPVVVFHELPKIGKGGQ